MQTVYFVTIRYWSDIMKKAHAKSTESDAFLSLLFCPAPSGQKNPKDMKSGARAVSGIEKYAPDAPDVPISVTMPSTFQSTPNVELFQCLYACH